MMYQLRLGWLTGDKEWAEKLGEAEARFNSYQSDSERYKTAIAYLQTNTLIKM